MLRHLTAFFSPTPLPPDLGLTFADLAEGWLADCERRKLRPNQLREARRLLVRDIGPVLGARPANAITRRDVAALLEAKAHRPGIARSCQSNVRRIFRWAVATGRLETDPTLGMRTLPMGKRDRVLSEAELAAVWRAVEPLGDYCSVVRLLLLTGARREEIGQLTWTEVDLQAQGGPVARLPASRLKQKRPHTIPLVPLALAQLPARRPGHTHVFGGRPGRGFHGWGTCKALLDRSLGGMSGHWVHHDLRRSFATHCAERGLALPHVIESQLAHQLPGVAGIYNRAAHLSERRALLKSWSRLVARITGDNVA